MQYALIFVSYSPIDLAAATGPYYREISLLLLLVHLLLLLVDLFSTIV